VVLLVAGMGGAGRSEMVNLLLAWLDARGIQTHSMAEVSDEEREHPPLWRYWRRLPARGHMGIFFGSWALGPTLQGMDRSLSPDEFDRTLQRVVDFERMLKAENTLVVKFWLHLSRRAQRKRLKNLEADPEQSWRVTREDWKLYRHYEDYRARAEHLIQRTNTAEAPWHIVEAANWRYRNLTVGRLLLDALRNRLEELHAEPSRPQPQPTFLQPPPRDVIRQLDMSLALSEADYQEQLLRRQAQLNKLTRRLRQKKQSLILVFEGADAAGKGGAIRRLTEAMDARDYQVMSTAAPTDEERAHPYLWRFWRHLPPRGKVTIYDRSWYGRVLVERVEGFCTQAEWQRAYAEINEFEAQLLEFGIIILKFWLAISPEEQLRRFQDRQTTPYKQYKLTPEDWRNRDRWDSYEAAACQMFEKTSTTQSPWVLVEAENKEWARIKVLRTVIERLVAELNE
jgi:polyphosphate:AMP phosphotransferase